MTFLERITPFLNTEDAVVQEFILHALHDYSETDRKTIELLIKEANQNEEKRATILLYLSVDPNHEELVRLLTDGIHQSSNEYRQLYIQLLKDLNPNIVWKNKDALEPYFSKDEWQLFDLLVNGTREDVKREYANILIKLEAEQAFDGVLYKQAKKIALTLVENNWITEAEIAKSVEGNIEKQWFDYDGKLAIYMISLIKSARFIPQLVPLLVRDDDVLLEEVAAALISLQSDEVVAAVSPYLLKEESYLYATSIIENIKSDYAIDVLRKAYHQVEDDENKEMIIEALAHHVSPKAEPEINDYVSKRPVTFYYSLAELAYSYYQLIGTSHPLFDEWVETIEEERNAPNDIAELSVNVEKVGRNDPCPCGSGKKYKKCCL
ncbi:SEC-C metal-binding domain-containing protein [Metabacillus niabensis]|uniref:SEC-C metal-binding domain-containing protein n=1 Tax=Metabacillus niabensis TaxID=324854 RepID=UPI0039A0C1ED